MTTGLPAATASSNAVELKPQTTEASRDQLQDVAAMHDAHVGRKLSLSRKTKQCRGLLQIAGAALRFHHDLDVRIVARN